MGDLQLDPFASNRRPILAPVKLKRFTGLKYQRNIGSTPGRLLRPMAILTPSPGKTQEPDTTTEFLGIRVDTLAMTLSITPEKLQSATTELHGVRAMLVRDKVVPRSAFRALAGRLGWLSALVRAGFSHTTAIWRAAYVGEGVAWCSSACRKVRELKVVKESGGGTSPQHEVYPLAMYRAANPSTCTGTKAREGQPMLALSPAAPPNPQKVASGRRPEGGGGAPYREGHAEPLAPAVKGIGSRRARRSAVGRRRGGHASGSRGRLCNATGDRAIFLTVKGRVRLTVRLFPMPPRPAGDVRVRVERDHQPVGRHAVRQRV